MRMQKFAIISCLSALALGAQAAKAEIGVTDTEVLIGAHTIESGAMAMYAPYSWGLVAYINSVNDAGGVNGRKIKLIKEDTQNQNIKTVEAMRKAIEQDKVFAIAGAQGNSHLAVVNYIEEKGVPDFFTDAALKYFESGLKSKFVTFYANDAEGYALGEYAGKAFKGKKACFIYPDNLLGIELFQGATRALGEANKAGAKVTIGQTLKVDPLAAQADSEMLKLKQDKCDVVMNFTYGSLAANTVNYATAQGFKPQWLMMWWVANQKFISLLSEGARDGIISTAAMAREDTFGVKGWGDFVKAMEKFGQPPSGSAATGYHTAELFVEALKRAGKDLTRESVVKAAESMNGWMCSLCIIPVNWSKDNHWAFKKPNLIETKGGKWILKK